MATVVIGPLTWSGGVDDEGHRTYKIAFLVRGLIGDGPADVYTTPGLPPIGSTWAFGNDIDLWAWRRPNADIKPHDQKDGEGHKFWTIDLTYSTKPLSTSKCVDAKIEDPLLQPQEVSGSFVKEKVEAILDRFGRPIVNSAHEQLRGAQVEFEEGYDQIRIKQNVPLLQLALFTGMRNTLNSSSLWGMPARTIRLSNATWEKKYYGQCDVYYTRTFEFDINSRGWDRDYLDEGTKVLNGVWDKTTGQWVLKDIAGEAPDPKDPRHFIRFTDRQGNLARVVLDGAGKPAGLIVGTEQKWVSLQDSNTGNELFEDDWWLPVNNDIESPYLWAIGTQYELGDVVLHEGEYFIGINNIATSDPNIEPNDPTTPDWVGLGSILTDKGQFQIGTNYDLGDFVEGVTISGSGIIHIEKYRESNFLLLGIPLVF